MHLQGGTHKEMPLPVVLVVDGAPRFLAEAVMSFDVVKGEVTESKILELVDSESQNPGDINGSNDGRSPLCCCFLDSLIFERHLILWTSLIISVVAHSPGLF